ncbi:VWA domain-containing protein, partial [Micromonospora aurantiaca]|nr:VWA domain-containing protein [Micromonospora aurantiaca]
LDTQKEAPGRTLVTLRQFDNEHETVFERVPLADVPGFKLIPRGMTALLDAIGSTIAAVNEYVDGLDEADRPGEVV